MLAALTGCSGQPFQTGDACDINPAACPASAGSGGSVSVAGANGQGGAASAGSSGSGGSAAAGAPLAYASGGSGVAGSDAGGSAAAGAGGSEVGGTGGNTAQGGTGGVVVIPLDTGGVSGIGGAPTAPIGVELDQQDWRVSASNTYFPETKAEYAIDADPQSCWASGTGQAPGMWFLVDLHQPAYFFRVDVGVIPGSSDYGRHLKLSASVDGFKFVPLRTGIEGAQNLQIAFDEAKYARYLKLELTADAGGLWWRIDDLHVMQ